MEDLMDFQVPKKNSSIIKVIGVGGGGSNAVNYMYKQGITGVDFVICNTDNQALDISPVEYKIHLGKMLTEGMGAGSKPEIGREAAIENLMDIEEMLNDNARMVFITAGMGGGTGTGAAPVIAKAAKDRGLLTVAIVTIPFMFEGNERILKALDGVEEIQHHVDALLVINNEKLKEMFGNLKLGEAFSRADSVLTTAAKGIAEIITLPGYVNVDFKDVQTVMKDSGVAIMGSGFANGPDRAIEAIEQALLSPLLNNNDVGGARKILLHITSGVDEITMDEVTLITDYLKSRVGTTASIIWGTGHDDKLEDKVGVTVIATGFGVSNIHEGLKGKDAVRQASTGAEESRKIFTLDDDGGSASDYSKQQTIAFEVKEEQAREVSFAVNKPDPQERITKFYQQKEAPVQEKNMKHQLEQIVDSKEVGIVDRLSEKQLQDESFIDYIDSVPAYSRKKKGMTQTEDRDISNFSISNNNGEWKISDRNKFLNDNVD